MDGKIEPEKREIFKITDCLKKASTWIWVRLKLYPTKLHYFQLDYYLSPLQTCYHISASNVGVTAHTEWILYARTGAHGAGVESLRRVWLFVTPVDCSVPGFPVLHYLLEFAQSNEFAHGVVWINASTRVILNRYPENG